ncbi:MAG: hypothetical protein ACRDLF_03785 [Solirubrobacteraceae bacterium]
MGTQSNIIKLVAALAAVGIVVSVIVIKSEKSEFDKIEAAVPGWLGENGCVKIEIKKPSSNARFVKWVGPNATTATFDCEYAGGFLDYARFPSLVARNNVLSSKSAPGKLCVVGRTVLMDALIDQDEPKTFPAMCRNLHGRRYPG